MNIAVPEKSDYIVKIAVFGAKQTGKTNILSRICYNDFTGSYKQTVGIDFFVKTVDLAEKKLKLQFWDIEVTPKSQSEKMRELCCKGIIAILIVYSIIDSSSFQYAQRLMSSNIGKQYLGNDVLKVLIANKMDLSSECKVSKENGQKMAESNGMVFMELSAKDCSGIKELEIRIGSELLNTIKKSEMK